MVRVKLNKKQQEEMKKIIKWFMEATEPIQDTHLKARVDVQILSRLACLSQKLTQPLMGKKKKKFKTKFLSKWEHKNLSEKEKIELWERFENYLHYQKRNHLLISYHI